MRRNPALLLVAAMALIAVSVVGCAKKAAEAPPVPPPAPPVVQPSATPEPTAPSASETPVPVPSVTAGDFTDVFFDLDSYALRDDAKLALDKAAKLMRDKAGVNLTIEGHCDERGTVEYNQALGEKRANAARDYLVNAGVSAVRVQTLSYGKERPFAEGHDESAWAQNRRAHFVLR
jgi:peptidoglycan-associated lipoprotein